MDPEIATTAAPETEYDIRRALVERVTAAQCFKRSARLRDFLQYVCSKALANQYDEIREQRIGEVVFGRRPEYNVGEDNIVRVEARELRKRLDTYFATDGIEEPLLILIPKGSYVPVFASRPVVNDASNPFPAGTEAESVTVHGPVPDSIPAIPPSSLLARSLAALSAALLIALLVLAWQNLQLRQQLKQQSAMIQTNRQPGFWGLLFGTDHQPMIVLSDTCWVLLQDFWHHDRSLRDYLSHKYMEELNTPEMRTVASRNFTDMADVTIVSELVQSYPYNHKLEIRSVRSLEVQDLKFSSVILIGSRRSNPWVEQFDQSLPFTDEFDVQSGKPYYLNHSPHAGEASRYITKGKDGSWEETYGAISYLPNLGHHGDVLLIEGSVAEATEAAGDYLCDPGFPEQLRQHLGLAPQAPIPHFEMLLKISALPGSPARVEYLTHRLLPDNNPDQIDSFPTAAAAR